MSGPLVNTTVAYVYTEAMDAFMRAGVQEIREAVGRLTDVERLLAETTAAAATEAAAHTACGTGEAAGTAGVLTTAA